MKLKIFFLFFIFVLIATPTFAAKKRVRLSGVRTISTSYSSVKLSRATNSVILNLFNLDKISKISYVLSYTANGIPQGAVGSISPTGTTDSRDLYFGTCSKGVCTPHTHITGATLTVTMILKSGGTYTKLYRIKV